MHGPRVSSAQRHELLPANPPTSSPRRLPFATRPACGAFFAIMQLSAADMKLLKSTKFPPEFEEKVDTTKVQMDIMKK